MQFSCKTNIFRQYVNRCYVLLNIETVVFLIRLLTSEHSSWIRMQTHKGIKKAVSFYILRRPLL